MIWKIKQLRGRHVTVLYVTIQHNMVFLNLKIRIRVQLGTQRLGGASLLLKLPGSSLHVSLQCYPSDVCGQAKGVLGS